MSKNKQILIFSGIGILVLAAVAAILMLTAPKEEQAPEEETTVTETDESLVIADAKSPLTKLTVTNSSGTYEITDSGEKDATDEIIYTIKDISSAPLLTDNLGKAVENASSMTAAQFVEETDDLKKYGLSEPKATVKAEFSDGTSHSFMIGDDVPNTSTKVYFTADGKNVYTYMKSALSYYTGDKFSFVDTVAVPAYNQQTGEEVLKLTVERKDLEEPIIIESIMPEDEEEIQVYSYQLVSPYYAYADLKDAPNFMYSLYGITAKSAQWVGLTEQDYELSGLNDPTCVITVESNKKTYTLTLGRAVADTVIDEEGNEKTEVTGFYGISSEVPDVLYLFNLSDIPAATIDPQRLISRLFLMPYIYSLETLGYSDKDGREFTMSFETTEVEDTVDENGEIVKGEDIHYHYLNGEAVEGEADSEHLKDMYQYIISAAGEELYLEEPKGELLATVVYTYADKTKGDNGVDTVRFYESTDDRKVIINLNGENLFKTRQMYITQLFSNVDSFLSGGEIILTY